MMRSIDGNAIERALQVYPRQPSQTVEPRRTFLPARARGGLLVGDRLLSSEIISSHHRAFIVHAGRV